MTMFILTDSLEVVTSNEQVIKEMNINFKGWYCPIDEWVVWCHHDGSMKSGVCGEKVLTRPNRPWWTLKNFKFPDLPHCPFSRKSCWCISDIKAPKAEDEMTYKMLLQIDPKKEYSSYNGEEIVGFVSDSYLIKKRFDLHIDIGDKCNFDCSYCPPHTHSKTGSFITYERLLFLLNNLHTNSNHKVCTLTGGEPMLFKQLEQFVVELRERNYSVVINSNGTGPESRYRRLIEEYNCRFNFSLHQEFTNRKLLNKLAALRKDYNRVHIKYMGDTNTDFYKMVCELLPPEHLEVSKLYNKTNKTEYILIQ